MSTLNISKDLEDKIKQIVLDTYYPIGTVYLSFNTDNPGNKFGGSWRICGSGRYLMCYDPNNSWFDKPGSDHGTASGPGSWRCDGTAITVNQMPSHKHTQAAHNHWIWGGTGSGMIQGYFPVPNWMAESVRSNSNGNARCLTENSTPAINNTGGGQAHDHFHVSPYMNVCVWERYA